MKQKAKRQPTIVRQGDVMLIKLASERGDVEPAPADPRGLVLAEGETSGHHHQVFGGARLYRFRDANNTARMLVVDREGAELRVVGGGSGGVDRHLPIQIESGAWEVRIQRCWSLEDEMRSRQVAD